MKEKSGRNKPCWCGSGKKYKNCHLNREKLKPPTYQHIIGKLKYSSKKEYCLCPPKESTNCAGSIVKAHSVQKSGALEKIALSGHVYGFDYSFIKHTPNDEIEIKKIGINTASTFTGFCGYHDNKIFENLDNNSCSSMEEYTFLLAYRAICRELFVKSAQSNNSDFLREMDKGKKLDEQIDIQSFAKDYKLGVESGLRDLINHKILFDVFLLNNDYSAIRYYIIKLSNVPNFMCSSVIYPEYDFNGDIIQDLGDTDKKMDLLSYTVSMFQSFVVIVFIWSEDSNFSSLKFVKSLHVMSDAELLKVLTRFVYITCENLFFNISWWNNLQPLVRDKLLERFNRAFTGNDYWTDDGINAINWKIMTRESNVIKT